jgi:hypothetical protein
VVHLDQGAAERQDGPATIHGLHGELEKLRSKFIFRRENDTYLEITFRL